MMIQLLLLSLFLQIVVIRTYVHSHTLYLLVLLVSLFRFILFNLYTTLVVYFHNIGFSPFQIVYNYTDTLFTIEPILVLDGDESLAYIS